MFTSPDESALTIPPDEMWMELLVLSGTKPFCFILFRVVSSTPMFEPLRSIFPPAASAIESAKACTPFIEPFIIFPVDETVMLLSALILPSALLCAR